LSEPGELAVGRVGRPHGLDGSFYVTRPLVRALAPGARLRVGTVERTIERRAGTDARPIVRLSGIVGRDAAQELRGAELRIDRESLPKLAEGEWWAHELAGLRVVAADGEIGTVREMIELPSCEALLVDTSDGAELIVPLVRDAVLRIDVPAGLAEVDAGFLSEE